MTKIQDVFQVKHCPSVLWVKFSGKPQCEEVGLNVYMETTNLFHSALMKTCKSSWTLWSLKKSRTSVGGEKLLKAGNIGKACFLFSFFFWVCDLHRIHWILLGHLDIEFYVSREGRGRSRPDSDVWLIVQFRPK